jgi:dCMP deaminase
MAHCTPETCIRVKNHIPSGEKLEMCKAVHAEQNLVVRLGDKLENATIYITTRPCTTCTKLLIQAGVREIVWDKDYDDTYATNLLQEYFNNTITIDEFGYKHITKSI